jgi:hypothetical protein
VELKRFNLHPVAQDEAEMDGKRDRRQAKDRKARQLTSATGECVVNDAFLKLCGQLP